MIIPFDGNTPRLMPGSWLAPTATLIGNVQLEAGSSVWYGSVIRGDGDRITLGANSNVQDGCVLHADPGLPLTIGSGVSVGHRAVLHGCTIADDVLVGMGAVVLNGATVGPRTLIAAGAVVLEESDIPADSLVAGVPAKVRRSLTGSEVDRVIQNARGYVELAKRHSAVTASVSQQEIDQRDPGGGVGSGKGCS